MSRGFIISVLGLFFKNLCVQWVFSGLLVYGGAFLLSGIAQYSKD